MNHIDNAFEFIHREDFLPSEVKDKAYEDKPLPIGYDQTNSQPSTVRQMMKWLDPHPGERVLDVGAGSGWTTALLSYLVRLTGAVYAVEKVPELVKFARNNLTRINRYNAYVFRAKDGVGLPSFGPYDKILVSAAAPEVPEELVDQLKIGGRLVIPVGNEIRIIDKVAKNQLHTRAHAGFVFVPLH